MRGVGEDEDAGPMAEGVPLAQPAEPLDDYAAGDLERID
jgi:hypothetical protein